MPEAITPGRFRTLWNSAWRPLLQAPQFKLSQQPKSNFVAFLIATLTSLLLLFLLRYSVLKYQYYFGMYHDDGVYLVSAQSLFDFNGYRICSLPFEPFQTKYPVGYPFFLSLLERLTGPYPGSLLPLSTVQAVLSVLALCAAAGYLVSTKKATPLLATVIASASLLNMRFIDFAPMLMSDLPAQLLICCCMWCAEKKSNPLAAGISLALAITMRTQAVVLLPALLIYYFVRRKFRSIFAVTGLTTLLIAPQVWWQSEHGKNAPQIISFYTNYLKHAYGTLPLSQDVGSAALGNFDWAVVTQINVYFPGLEQIPYEQLSPLSFFLLYKGLYYLLAIPSLTGLAVKLRRTSLPALYCFFYICSFCIWPIKLEWRHVLPVIIFGYYFYFVGFRFYSKLLKSLVMRFGLRKEETPATLSAARLKGRRLQYAVFCNGSAITFGIYLIVGACLMSCAREPWCNPLASPPVPRTAAEYRDAMQWVRQNTLTDAVFVCNNDPVLFLETGRHAIMPSRLELWRFSTDNYVDAGSLSRAIKYSGATYVMNEPAFRSMGLSYHQLQASIQKLQQQAPAGLTAVYRSPQGLVEIYKIN